MKISAWLIQLIILQEEREGIAAAESVLSLNIVSYQETVRNDIIQLIKQVRAEIKGKNR